MKDLALATIKETLIQKRGVDPFEGEVDATWERIQKDALAAWVKIIKQLTLAKNVDDVKTFEDLTKDMIQEHLATHHEINHPYHHAEYIYQERRDDLLMMYDLDVQKIVMIDFVMISAEDRKSVV